MTGLMLALPLLAFPLPPPPADAPATLACPALDAPSSSCDAPAPTTSDPRFNGGWLDCYAGCIDAQRPRCIEQCGSHDPMTNPCLAICYDAIAIGCSIGCTRLSVVPYTVDQATP